MSNRDPFDELERAFDLLGDQFGVDVGSVPTDVVDAGDAFHVVMDLPGYTGDDIDVQLVEARQLSVSASRSDDHEYADSDGRFVQRERRTESVSRSVALPEAVDDDATASFDNGVLTVHLPKRSADDEGTDIPVN